MTMYLKKDAPGAGQPLPEDLMEAWNALGKDQEASQSMTAQTRFGFNLEELFAEEAESVPHYAMKGWSEKCSIDLWSGMAKTFVTMFQENEELAGDFMRSKAKAVLPMFLASVNGVFDVTVDAQAIADLLEMPEA